MKVLIACEFSGIVRDAFAARGHDAWSCDLEPSERPGQHIQGEVEQILDDGWDMMIAHPPCTYLSYAGTAHWTKPGRAEKRAEAMKFFIDLYDADVPKVCIENPFGWPCQAFRKPSQIVNPFDFGESVRKRTCLWLRGLPILTRGDELWPRNQFPVEPPEPCYVGVRKATGKPKARYDTDVGTVGHGRKWHWTESISPTKDRKRERSRTFRSIAEAMAEQWGSLEPGNETK
jgi:hypothetical protein